MSNKTKPDNKEKTKENKEYKEISLFKNPITTLTYLLMILSEQFIRFISFLIKNKIILVLCFGYYFLNFFDGPHSQYISLGNKIGYFCLYWILLGVASSIGLGTGLHTFVLYLGPYIAKVTLAANECSYFPEMYPSKWEFREFLPCGQPATAEHSISFWSILSNVQLEAFMWGLGTAIGELPPYFMAKAAAEAGKSNEEIEELRQLEGQNPNSFMDRIKSFLYSHLKRHGFITVLLCASIPNPLFDLAGITCGHFSIPFWTFFGATAIGKAIIKVHLQAVFVIITFSKHHVEALLNMIESHMPFLKNSLSESLEKQKKMLWHKESAEQMESAKPLVATVWEIFISVMILYFLISIINSVVNDRRRKDFENNKEKDE